MRRVCDNGDGFLVRGEINFKNVVDLREQGIASLREYPHSQVCIDLSSVTQVDNVALALLTAWSRDAHQINKKVVYRNLPQALENMAKIFGVDFLFDKHPSEFPIEKKNNQKNSFVELSKEINQM